MINCRNRESWPNTHAHNTVDEVRRCWLSPAAPVAASSPPPPTVPVIPPVVTHPPGTRMISPGQKKYINDLGSRWEVQWTYAEASAHISSILGRPKVDKMETDPRLKMIEGMIDMIPDGYYATAKDEGGHVDFLRISRPTRGRFAGTVKIQTEHSEQWRERMVRWASGKWSVYDSSVIEPLMLVIADHKTCARRYSIELQSCCVCNKLLTDDRSRHYLIGPICDKKDAWQYMIEWVDEHNDGLSFEELVRLGKPTRVWQDRSLAS